MQARIDKDALIKADEWTGYTPLKREFKYLRQEPSGKKGRNFPDMHRVMMSFKGWLRGVHHHVERLQSYVDEYTCRFNKSSMKGAIFENFLNRMFSAQPYPYKSFSS